MGQEIHRVAYFSKIALVFVAFLLLRSPLYRTLLGYQRTFP